MDKPIPEAVVEAAQELIDSVAGMVHAGWCQCWQYGADDDRCECGLTTAKKEAKALKAALTAAQQQGQAVCDCGGGYGPDKDGHLNSCRVVHAGYRKPTQQGQAVACNVEGTWLWCKLMDWCKQRGLAPATQDKLFAITGEAHKLYTAPPPSVPVVDEATARRLDDYLGGEFDIRIGKQAAHAALCHALATQHKEPTT